jgi:hypothetical protein
MSDSYSNRYSAIIHAIAVTSALAIVSSAMPANRASFNHLQAFQLNVKSIQR